MKFFILQDNGLILMRNDAGDECSFGSIQEFEDYTGETLPVTDSIDYEPDLGIYIIGFNNPVNPSEDFSFFDNLIENIPLYKERLDDPFWGMDDDQQRTQAFLMKTEAIILRRTQENSKNFWYNRIPYKSDEINIQGVRLSTEKMIDSAKIPTFKGTALEGTWATADERFIPFTVSEFRKFSNEYFAFRSANFTNYTLLTMSLTQIYYNGASKDDILNFNIDNGWV